MFKVWGAPGFWGAVFSAAVLFLTLVGGAQAQATTAADVIKQIKALQEVIKTFDGKDSVAAEVNGLRRQLLDKKLIGNSATDVFTQYNTDLQAFLADAGVRQSLQESRSATDVMTTLLAALYAVTPDMPDAQVKERFIVLLNGVSGLIDKGRSNQVVLGEALLAPALPEIDKRVQQARDTFTAAWSKITEGYKKHVMTSEALAREQFLTLLKGLTNLISPNEIVLAEALLKPAAGEIPIARKEFDTAWAAITEDYRRQTTPPEALVRQQFLALLNGLEDLIKPNQILLSKILLEAPGQPIPEARGQFDKAWVSITEPYKVHVIRSWYGDLRTNWREGRLCAATSAMMTKCQAKHECKLDPAPAGQPGQYDQLTLCGYDPAPLVDPDFKGVATEFTCVRGGTDVWDALAQHPGINPKTDAPWKNEDIHVATLRSSGMSFRCPFPVKPAAVIPSK